MWWCARGARKGLDPCGVWFFGSSHWHLVQRNALPADTLPPTPPHPPGVAAARAPLFPLRNPSPPRDHTTRSPGPPPSRGSCVYKAPPRVYFFFKDQPPHTRPKGRQAGVKGGCGPLAPMGCGSSQHALDAYAEENLTLHLDLMYELYGKPTEQVGEQ